MARIELEFVAGSDLVSDAIKAFSRGWCSHVDAVLPDGGRLGARLDGGVAVRLPGYERWTRSMRLRLPAADAVAERFYAVLRGELGKPYDERAIFAFAFGRDWRSPERWFCSELQAWALERSGYFPQALAAVVSEITPRDLLLILSPFAEIVETCP